MEIKEEKVWFQCIFPDCLAEFVSMKERDHHLDNHSWNCYRDGKIESLKISDILSSDQNRKRIRNDRDMNEEEPPKRKKRKTNHNR